MGRHGQGSIRLLAQGTLYSTYNNLSLEVQGDPSGWLKPPVDLVPIVLGVGGPLPEGDKWNTEQMLSL